ncbi:MAG: hypothetical protein VR70_10180 [Rhodospirillaceae bacterium BRH_c57]|nr:MAG: hypothetical protein VR70_10180 [Rhodospirillaceae bacterium BRH_c57]
MFQDTRNLLGSPLLAVALTALVAVPAVAEERSTEDTISLALSAAPPQMRNGATVVGADSAVLRQGDNGFTCMITPEVPTGSAPMCADETWMPWAAGWLQGEPYEPQNRLGLAYMLAGDTATGGASNIDPHAQAPATDNQWVVEGPHVMLIVPDEEMLSHITDDHTAGTPYVMWRGTPFAHVMMPVGPREHRREVAERQE